ncbi:leucine-rich repeat flightless-interacting protein 2 isoform X1 [Notothenia coriiceps]|uniref:Leucine-rich repeat flightless-interacting protein 2 n=1 Tax=Notothenia coriiceps TaxID=8208 RepID=A0A6I9MI98_9TELE|nr:PREDICTED: leucine-rich repeat flightless-interacting protein 2 isoform X1 [Notothenia coriiceps]XP_010764202.1 PREDICTED: leucine-rich repeat flightless-interacting protein 2 isoform X1 [Notothenia coriiceps]
MGTQGSGRKRAPLKDRFSAEDEALSSIAREAEARLAAKRAARAEARDIRMRELERQQKERSYHTSSSSSNKKWGQIHQWMADSDKARGSSSSISSSSHRRGLDDDVMSVRSYRSTSSSVRDVGSKSRSSSLRRDPLSDALSTSSALKTSRSTSSVYNDLHGHKRSSSSSSRKDLLAGLYHDQRNYTSLTKTKPTPPSSTSTSTYTPRATTSSSSSTTGTALPRSYSMASIGDDAGLYGSGQSSRAPSELSWYSSGAGSTRSSPASSSDDDTVSSVSQERVNRGRRDSVSSDFSDISESAADYFSRTNRRGSIVSDLDDLSIPDLDSLDEKCDKQYSDFSRPSSRCATPGLSVAALASLGGSSSRRGSTDTGSIYDADTSLSELRESLAEVEEKYKKAMVSNAQLDNDKGNFIYQVDTLKDVIEEMEEQMSEMKRELEDKSKDLERQKHTCTVLQHKQDELKEGIRQRDELIEESQRMQTKLDALTREVFDLQETINWKDKKIGALERQKEYFDCIRSERDELRDELSDIKGKAKAGEKHGLVIISDGTPNGDVNHEPLSSGITVVSQEAAQVLESAGEGPLDVRLRKLAEEKDELLAQIRKLKNQLEEERQKHSKMDSAYTDGERMENGTDLHIIEMQRDSNRQMSEYKFKLSKAEQELGTMEQNINRLEGQVSRYKASADSSEKVEDELKTEKRRLQRELRMALDKNEEMEMTNNHLVKRLEKMKANRNALLSQQ